MTGLMMGRYVLEWGAILVVCVTPIFLLPQDVLDAGKRLPAVLGVAVAGIAEIVVYVAVGQAMLTHPERVIGRWVFAVIGKLFFFGAGAALVALFQSEGLKPFLLALGCSFLVLSFHQVFRIVQMADRVESSRKQADAGAAGDTS